MNIEEFLELSEAKKKKFCLDLQDSLSNKFEFVELGIALEWIDIIVKSANILISVLKKTVCGNIILVPRSMLFYWMVRLERFFFR